MNTLEDLPAIFWSFKERGEVKPGISFESWSA
jgi:hypothetical protein